MQINGTQLAPPHQRPLLGLVHGLPNSEYHSGPGLSASGLKNLRRSPWHYRALNLLPRPDWFGDDDDEDTTTSTFAGTLCHCATLEPQEFDARYVVGPEGVNKNTKEWKAFVASSRPRTVISARQHAIAHGQAAALRSIDAVAEILDGGECEVSGYWIDKATGILCRCRPDCANRTFGSPESPVAMLLDVKTTSDASRAAVKNTIARFGYHHQAEWYSRGYAQASGVPVAGFIFAFVEQAYPFACRVFELDPHTYDVARQDNREALELYARCERERHWPGYPSEVEAIGLPRWAGGQE